MNTLNPKLQIHLLGNIKEKHSPDKGFTLIELMVTVATLGVLAAAAFPAFSGAQTRAAAGATIGSMQAFAKECATNTITGNSTDLSIGSDVSMSTLDCGVTTGTLTVKNATAFSADKIEGLKCGSNDTVGANGSQSTCTLTITPVTGAISGAWS